MKTKTVVMTGLLTSALFFLGRKKAKANEIQKITSDFTKRGCDPEGCGHFGASRGSRKHMGVDIATKKGQAIFSPISGYLNRIAYPYPSDLSYKGIEIIGTGVHINLKVKIFYCTPVIKTGNKVVAGVTKVAISQAINEKYNPKMTNHVHLELYVDGKIVDPIKYLKQR